MSKPEIAFAMVMGPGQAEMVIDNIEAICSLYPGSKTWIRNDHTTDGSWEQVQEWSRGKPVRLSRNRSRYGYYRLAQTYGELLLEIADAKPDLLIKIDPDTVLIRSGLIELFQERFTQHGPGICGSHRTSPDGMPRSFRHHALLVALDTMPVGPKKKVRTLRWKPVGYFPHILKALRRGYRIGENVQGGLYAVDGRTLQELSGSGFLKAMAFGRHGMVWADDVLITLGVRSVGGVISPLNAADGVASTHIQSVRPLYIKDEHLFGPQLLAVHPIKSEDAALRSALRAIRLGQNASQEIMAQVPEPSSLTSLVGQIS